MNKSRLSALILALALIGMSACSQKTTTANNPEAPSSNQRSQPRGKGKPAFSELLARMDSNKDGKLSQAEVQGPLKNDFTKVDKDQDGFITEEEFKNAPPPRRRSRQ